MSSSNIKDKVQQFGLTEVYCSPDPEVDIVLVHGLNGHPYKTWATQKPEVFWPTDLLPDMIEDQHCRILTYGYDANVATFTDGASKDHIHNHAEHLAARLVANRSVKARERPIIFIAHSLGGLVVKRLLIYCESINNPKLERLRSIYVSTFGILFLGTPHNGSDLAKWGSLLQSICHAVMPKKMVDSSSQLVDALKTNNETLQNINRLFIEIVDPLRIYFFHEAKPMDLKGTRQFIVDEASAAPVMQGVERMGIEKDHSNMCKFESTSAPGFDVVADAIAVYAEEAPARVKARWEREKQVREYHRQSMAKELLGDRILNVVESQSQPQSQPLAVSKKENNVSSMGASSPQKLLEDEPTVTPYAVEEAEEIPVIPVSSLILPSRTNLLVLTESSIQSVKRLDTESSQSSSKPPRVAPLQFRPNSIFVGFEIEFDQLRHKLRSEKKSKIGSCAVLICGPPGSGKSHLARQYVWTHQTDYPAGIFWVDCKSRQSRDRYYWDIGQALGCLKDSQTIAQSDGSYLATIRKSLESRQGWLIVFDGVFFDSDDALSEFIPYLPDSPGNSIIYTSIDPTLKARHRLLNPSWVRMRPLSSRAARELLFKSLGIHEYTSAQERKAQELVRYYGFLPLGIHAAAHMLIAQGRSLEKFSPATSDQRLINPFLAILRALEARGYTEAVNLLALACFLNHKMPVVLLQFGASAFSELGRDIRSLDRIGGVKRDLDNTISVLLRYGLIDRELQTCSVSTSDRTSLSPLISRTTTDTSMTDPSLPAPHLPEDDSDVRLMIKEDANSTSSASVSITIDTLRVHTITQVIIREEIKARGLQGMSYNDWLLMSCRFLAASYRIADLKLRSFPGPGSVADYREYKSHISNLWKLLPKSHKDASDQLAAAREETRHIYREIQDEIKARSPSQSQSSKHGNFKYIGSIFETSGSSDEEHLTPKSDITRASTWTPDDADAPSESPVEYHGAAHVTSEPVFSDLDDDDGYATELDDLTSTVRSSQRLSIASEATMVPGHSNNNSPRTSLLQIIWQGHPDASHRKNLGEFKPVPTLGKVSNPQVHSMRPRSVSTSSSNFSWPFRTSSTGSLAEAALSNVQAKSPTNELRSLTDRKASSGSENRDGSTMKPARHPLGNLPANAQLITTPTDNQLQAQDVKHHSRRTSTSPRLANAVLAREAARVFDDIPIEENITITRRYPAHPEIVPGFTRPSARNAFEPRTSGYSSVPMSRDVSRESNHSLLSDPAEYTQAPDYLNPMQEQLYSYQKESLPSIDSAMARSFDFSHSGSWAYNSPFGLEDDLRQVDMSNIQTRVVPASAPISPRLGSTPGFQNGNRDPLLPALEIQDEERSPA